MSGVRDAIEKVIVGYCDGTWNGLKDATFVEYRTDGKTPLTCLNEIMDALKQLKEQGQ